MVLKTIAKTAVKAAKNPIKAARAVDKGISKVANVAKKVNNAADKRSAEKYYKTVAKMDKAEKSYVKAATSWWPVEYKVAARAYDKAKANRAKDAARDRKVWNAVQKVNKILSKFTD